MTQAGYSCGKATKKRKGVENAYLCQKKRVENVYLCQKSARKGVENAYKDYSVPL